MNKLKTIFYNIKYGVQNIFIWMPTIWKNRDWDFQYIYDILYKKIQLIEKSHIKYDIHTDKEKTIKEIRQVREILERIVNDNYLVEALKPVEEEFGEWKLEFEPIPNKSCSRMIDNRSAEHREAWSKASNYVDQCRKQDKEELFKLLNQNIERWWH